MANTGHYIDRNPTLRAAGVSTNLDDFKTQDCLTISHIEEKAEHLIQAECRRKRRENAPLLMKLSPIMPNNNMEEIFSGSLTKSRFLAFKEKFTEDMYLKKSKVGRVKPAFSKPNDVNNVNYTFGHPPGPSEPLYTTILPQKSAEQVNREYGEFHEQHLISHNHYWPAEQINRKYTKPFNRMGTFGKLGCTGDNGLKTKRCMQQCDHWIIVSKPQMDYIDRSHSRMGKKLKSYPYDIPPGITHGTASVPSVCDCKMLIENIDPCVNNKKLIDALGHLNKWRHKLQECPDFEMFDLISVLERDDKDRTGYLPLKRIFNIMRKMHLRIDDEKMRIAMSNFKLILDEGCATERINYREFCRLLSLQEPLPTLGNIYTIPINFYNKDTTYRLLCSDLKRKPNESPRKLKPVKDEKHDDDHTRAKHLIAPNIATLLGLGLSDFEKLREREQLERIFKEIVDKDGFETIWEDLKRQHYDQNELFSVQQFRETMKTKQLFASPTLPK
ncbi:uncharacterized protein LOC115631644 [Scaptodrosophila lebanonensis]|uniref:Uncharacterized protein LOC115631644 n=1 Tax=Drosophila lebanonensis TaxID=7225 RepID=A0A6J2U8L1_DROLE|nr:uncharacterized protein LOC115631644 [Scaptodrosophila lebanonensis]